MTLQEKLKNIPHGELIVPKGSITIKSLFQFKDVNEILEFLHGCEMGECSVKFANEDIVFDGFNKLDIYTKFLMSVCMLLKTNPRILSDYERFKAGVSNGEFAADKVELSPDELT